MLRSYMIQYLYSYLVVINQNDCGSTIDLSVLFRPANTPTLVC